MSQKFVRIIIGITILCNLIGFVAWNATRAESFVEDLHYGSFQSHNRFFEETIPQCNDCVLILKPVEIGFSGSEELLNYFLYPYKPIVAEYASEENIGAKLGRELTLRPDISYIVVEKELADTVVEANSLSLEYKRDLFYVYTV